MLAQQLDKLRTDFLQQAPIGTICPWSYSLIPKGWLLCDGQELACAEYQTLFEFLCPAFSLNDQSETFALPHIPSPFEGVHYIIRAAYEH